MKVLALSPHTDDAELGAGGVMTQFIEDGHEVTVAAFGTGDAESGASGDEYACAMDILGITDWRLFDFPACYYPSRRQGILSQLEVLRDEMQPDLILCPSVHDSHQDHIAIAMETIRAFKYYASILAYEAAWNCVIEPFRPICFIRLEERHIQTKMQALECYASQTARAYWNMDFIRGQALVHGMRVRARYAEAFEVVRWIR